VLRNPSLDKNPQLTENYSREEWIQAAYDTNHSESARGARQNIAARLDHYCFKVHNMSPEETFNWIKKQSKDPDVRSSIGKNFLQKYVKFCQDDHRDIIINKGRNPNKNKQNKNNFLHKLHDNSIHGIIVRSRGFMSQVGGIRLHDDDMKLVIIPTTEKRGLYDDEEAEPLTAEQARDVIGRTRDHRSIVLYHFMNDTAFRISEAGLVTDSDFDLSANPPTVKVPNISIKGVKYRGVRFLRDTTAYLIKTLLKDDDNHFTFRRNNNQKLTAFRQVELKKIRHVYDKLGMNQIYEDTGRKKYNLHSWRKRCGTEYGRTNTESMADGYLRHSKYLAQYHIKKKEERIEAFRRAEIDLAIDEAAKQKLKIKNLEKEKSELQISKKRVDELERIQNITINRINQMTGSIRVNRIKQKDDGKSATEEQLEELTNLVRLRMDVDPEFAKEYTKWINKTAGFPTELRKKFLSEN